MSKGITDHGRPGSHHLFSHHQEQPPGQPDHYEPYSTEKPPQMASFFNKIGELITGKEDEENQNTHEQVSEVAAQTAQEGAQKYADHRYLSFAPKRHDNDIKWFVDGCGYMWAVSEALEKARESIWILDCETSAAVLRYTALTCLRVAFPGAVPASPSREESDVPH